MKNKRGGCERPPKVTWGGLSSPLAHQGGRKLPLRLLMGHLRWGVAFEPPPMGRRWRAPPLASVGKKATPNPPLGVARRPLPTSGGPRAILKVAKGDAQPPTWVGGGSQATPSQGVVAKPLIFFLFFLFSFLIKKIYF